MLSKVLVLAIFLASTQALSIKINPKADIEITECAAGTADWVEFNLNFDPYPIQIATGKQITLDGALIWKQAIDERFTTIYEVVGDVTTFGKVPIPCFQVTYTCFMFCSNFLFVHFQKKT